MYSQIVSEILDEMQKRWEEEDNKFKKQILRRFIVILEEYVN